MPRVKLFDKKEVLNKATELFWKKGYHATSIQDLVSFLGINRGSLYDTFGGKKALFNQAFQLYRTTSIAGIAAFLEKQDSVKGGFRALFEMAIKESVTDADRKGCFVVNTTTELVPGETALLNILQKNKEIFEEIFYQFLLKGEESGEIPKGKNLKSIASLLYTLNNGIKVVAKIQPKPKKLLDTVDTVLTLLD